MKNEKAVFREKDKLSKDFSLNEFKVSKSFPELADQIQFSVIDYLHLKLLCQMCLQPIRDKFGAMRITSGKRSNELNSKIGGTLLSDHLISCAADFQLIYPNFLIKEVYRWIVKDSEIDYRQVIWYPKSDFIHISINSPFNQKEKEALIYTGGEYVTYKEDLINQEVFF